MRLLLVWSAALALAACDAGDDAVLAHHAVPHTFAERFAAEQGRIPLNYANESSWACTADRKNDVCDHDFTMARMETDGTVGTTPYAEAQDPPVDCFYIYPTLDFNVFQGVNHDDVRDVALPLRTIEAQAGPFSSVCRMFVPLYRQGNFGAYETELNQAVWVFRNAFADVAAAWEYYLRHWNRGRPVVVLGHSQGAQHATYLLHTYFDGDRQVTDIPGSETTAALRKRLVIAFPLGFQVFVPRGKLVGGSFSDIPLCSDDHTPGCVVHYRSFVEGYEFAGGWGDDPLEARMAEGGLLNRVMDPAGDDFACVNPGLASLGGGEAIDLNGASVGTAGTRVLTGTYVVGVTTLLDAGPRVGRGRHYPGRYTATCRYDPKDGSYLAIGYHAPAAGADLRADPFDIDGDLSLGAFGLHTFDFNLALGDLVEHVRRRSPK
jgi:hypothetical protein